MSLAVNIAALEAVSSAGFELRPLTNTLAPWNQLIESVPTAATLYHRERWLEVLRRAYGMDLMLATVGPSADPAAGCLLARSKNPLCRRLISLPFSDFCPPLYRDTAALEA